MSLTKIDYVDEVTVIPASNLNEIQDEIITMESDIAELQGDVQTVETGLQTVENDVETNRSIITSIQNNFIDDSTFEGYSVGMCVEFVPTQYLNNYEIDDETGEWVPAANMITSATWFYVSAEMTLDCNIYGKIAFYEVEKDHWGSLVIEYQGSQYVSPGQTYSPSSDGYIRWDNDLTIVPYDDMWIRNHSYVDDILGDVISVLDSINGEVI